MDNQGLETIIIPTEDAQRIQTTELQKNAIRYTIRAIFCSLVHRLGHKMKEIDILGSC